jgi:hypothetical protein
VIRLYGYECLGSGEMLAHYLIRPRYKRVANVTSVSRQTKQDICRIAFDALSEVKKTDPNCGGDTEWLTLSRDGQMSRVQKLRGIR